MVDPQLRSQVQQIDIPDALNTLVDYPIAVLKNGTNARGGHAFVNYALSAPAQDVFSRWGFTTKGAP
jgi:ABC-type molybdate transport system substrate-binding protein